MKAFEAGCSLIRLGLCVVAGVAVVLCAASVSCAQPARLVFERFDMEHGLSHYHIQSLLQDRQGFLWIGTQAGLNRYDGYTFVPFTKDATDSTSLSDDYINALHQDRAGFLWIGTRGGGLNRFDPATGRFTSFRHDTTAVGSLSHDEVLALYESGDGSLWIGTRNGLNRLVPDAQTFTRYLFDTGQTDSLSQGRINAVSQARINAVVEMQDGMLWVGTGNGLVRFTPETGGVPHRLYTADGLSDDFITSLYEDHDGILWIGTQAGGLNRYDPATETFTSYRHDAGDPQSLSHDHVYSLYEDRAHTLWVSTMGGGLNVLDRATGQFTSFQHDPKDPQSLSDNNVHAVLEDRSGVFWVGTFRSLDMFSEARTRFAHSVLSQRLNPNLENPWVRAVHEDRQGNLWVGTVQSGLYRFDPQTGTTRRYTHDPDDPASLSRGDIWCLDEDRQGYIWICVMDAGIDRLDPRTGRVTNFRNRPTDPRSLSSNRVLSVFEDRAGFIWIGSYGKGLNRFDPATETFTPYRHDTTAVGSLSHDRVWPIFEDHQGTLWIGTDGGGLNRFDPATETFTPYRHDSTVAGSLSSNSIVSINEYPPGTLWLGTFSDGLMRFDPASGVAQTYTQKDGLPGGSVSGVLPDEQGHLWISAGNGLARFYPEKQTFTLYSVSDGLPSNTSQIGAYTKSRSGTLIFGTQKGMVAFYPANIHDNPRAPPVVLTDFKLFNESVRLDTLITAMPTISLPYDQNFIAFEFAALDFSIPSKNVYAYQLVGLDEEWIQAGNRRFASYPNLAPGQYTFRVKATNNDGVWNEEGVSVNLTIDPPYWQTWWFRSLVALAVIGLLAAAYTYRVRHLLHVERMRMRIARGLHDDIGTNLSSIALKSEMVGARGELDDRGKRQLIEVSRTARETAHTLREMVWVVNTEYDTLDKLISKMEDLTTTMLDGHLAHTFTCTPQQVPAKRLRMEFRQHVYFLYKEALHNVVKHAGATRVKVDVSIEQGLLHVRVEDDGVGFIEEQIQAGDGLRNMRKRVEDIRGRLEITSQPGQGTRLVLIAPIA